jgi:hypothetical protein
MSYGTEQAESLSGSSSSSTEICSHCEYEIAECWLKQPHGPVQENTVCELCDIRFCAFHLETVVQNFAELLATTPDNSLMFECAGCEHRFCKYGLLGDPEQNIESSKEGPNGAWPYAWTCLNRYTDYDDLGLEKRCPIDGCGKLFCGRECFEAHCRVCEHGPPHTWSYFHPRNEHDKRCYDCTIKHNERKRNKERVYYARARARPQRPVARAHAIRLCGLARQRAHFLRNMSVIHDNSEYDPNLLEFASKMEQLGVFDSEFSELITRADVPNKEVLYLPPGWRRRDWLFQTIIETPERLPTLGKVLSAGNAAYIDAVRQYGCVELFGLEPVKDETPPLVLNPPVHTWPEHLRKEWSTLAGKIADSTPPEFLNRWILKAEHVPKRRDLYLTANEKVENWLKISANSHPDRNLSFWQVIKHQPEAAKVREAILASPLKVLFIKL